MMMRTLAAAALACVVVATASAEPLRLRADAFSSAEPMTGFLVLQGRDKMRPWLDLEALVWAGGSDQTKGNVEELSGDALVAAVRLRDPKGRGTARLGRFVLVSGAMRPVHLDGAQVVVRSRRGPALELFGGIPVVPRGSIDRDRSYDWLVGARTSWVREDWGAAGLSFFERREGGALSDLEAGIDVTAIPVPWLDLTLTAAYDLLHPGLSDARLAMAGRRGPVRGETYLIRRSPSRLLPATSIFSVLGDVPSDEVGGSARWRLAPRLDVFGAAALREVDGDPSWHLTLRTTLRLDDRGRGALSIEGRRLGQAWTGARAAARVPLGEKLMATSELEIVFPSEPAGRGDIWPWGLVGLTWQPHRSWELAAAIEGSASTQHERQVTAIGRATRRWEP